MNDNVTSYGSLTTSDTAVTTATAGDWVYTTPNYDISHQPVVNIPSVWFTPTPLYQNKKGDDNMCYLYEVILVNPKDDDFAVNYEVAKSETSALMEAYKSSQFNAELHEVPFDDLKTSCRVLMSWTKEKSLEKALETIKKAVE